MKHKLTQRGQSLFIAFSHQPRNMANTMQNITRSFDTLMDAVQEEGENPYILPYNVGNIALPILTAEEELATPPCFPKKQQPSDDIDF